MSASGMGSEAKRQMLDAGPGGPSGWNPGSIPGEHAVILNSHYAPANPLLLSSSFQQVWSHPTACDQECYSESDMGPAFRLSKVSGPQFSHLQEWDTTTSLDCFLGQWRGSGRWLMWPRRGSRGKKANVESRGLGSSSRQPPPAQGLWVKTAPP